MPRTRQQTPPPAAGAAPPREREIFANRTLNLRAIRAIGYDMDYTLVHYQEDEWERRAYEHARRGLEDRGWPVADLEYEPGHVTRGLVVDLRLGNLLKATRFGYVIRACHGTRVLDFPELREAYARTLVDLDEPRFVFLNTLFSLSEATLFGQLVELHDAAALPEVRGYEALWSAVRNAIDAAHLEGELKAGVLRDPERYVVLDPELVLALRDQRAAGKKLLLITNSDWAYADPIMHYAFDRYLPAGETWRALFDVVVVAASKPSFFGGGAPLYELVDEERGLLRPAHGGLRAGGVFHGGSAAMVERHLSLSGDEILYVGDHVYADVYVSKEVLRWRTALIVRELEDEVRDLAASRDEQRRLGELMDRKAAIEREGCAVQLALQRARLGYGPDEEHAPKGLERRARELRAALQALDHEIAPLASGSASLGATPWGPLMRAGNDKSLFARQVERYADVYASRASNFLAATPFAFLRAPRTSLPHDRD